MSASGGVPDAAWEQVDLFAEAALAIVDPAADMALSGSRAAGLPDIAVSPAQGRWLRLMARMAGARRILEVGTLGGYSTAWLAGALPPGGRLVTLELDPHHAASAYDSLTKAGLGDRVEVRVGLAADSLATMAQAGEPPFDFAFIDADKVSYPRYLELVIPLMRVGGAVVADNVVRRGRILSPQGDVNAEGARAFIEAVGHHPRLQASLLQTVGVKGHDGMLLAVVG